MVICHCRAVSHHVVEASIDAGAADVEELGRMCGAGTSCGGCRPALRGMLAAPRSEQVVTVRSAA